MKDVIENNKLIAEFMELYYNVNKKAYINTYESPSFLGHNREEDELEFHTSWDWLMPVISKITRDESLIENEYRESIMDTAPYGLIEDTYKTVVEFIKYYNKEPLNDVAKIIEYNEEMHIDLTEEQLKTIDETEIDEFIKWYNENK